MVRAGGTPAAAIQEHYLAGIRAGERRDAEGQLAEMNRMVEAARSAGFAEVVAAMNRYGLALGDHPTEPQEVAVKAVTLAIYALPFRPRSGSTEARLLNAWAEWDIAARTVTDEYEPATEAFVNAIKAAQAPKVLAALMLFLRGYLAKGQLHLEPARGCLAAGQIPLGPANDA